MNGDCSPGLVTHRYPRLSVYEPEQAPTQQGPTCLNDVSRRS